MQLARTHRGKGRRGVHYRGETEFKNKINNNEWTNKKNKNTERRAKKAGKKQNSLFSGRISRCSPPEQKTTSRSRRRKTTFSQTTVGRPPPHGCRRWWSRARRGIINEWNFKSIDKKGPPQRHPMLLLLQSMPQHVVGSEEACCTHSHTGTYKTKTASLSLILFLVRMPFSPFSTTLCGSLHITRARTLEGSTSNTIAAATTTLLPTTTTTKVDWKRSSLARPPVRSAKQFRNPARKQGVKEMEEK